MDLHCKTELKQIYQAYWLKFSFSVCETSKSDNIFAALKLSFVWDKMFSPKQQSHAGPL